jgi:hypothetical protein
MLCVRSVSLRQLARGDWADEMRYWRFLGNRRVTAEKIVEGWSDQTRLAVRGRHILALQDTSEIKFATSEDDRRGLGKVGKGNLYGVLLHAMLAVDADTGVCLGLGAGKVWTRQGDVEVPHAKRALEDKETLRWVATTEATKEALAEAREITDISDREGDFYAHWARTPGGNVHLLSRVMHDHALIGGGTLRKAAARAPFCAKAVIDLRQRLDRPARQAHLSLRFGAAALKRPENTKDKGLPKSVALNFVEVVELHPPKGAEAVHWLLLTTHEVRSVEDAFRIVGWYKMRWIIEQLFRSMKRQGLRVEDSQLQSAERLVKMVAIAAKAATIVIQLVQARSGGDAELPAQLAFSAEEIEALEAVNKSFKGKTALQTNPHPKKTLAWAAWIIAKLGGWSGYASHKPPGPITFHNGLDFFQKLFVGWAMKDV